MQDITLWEDSTQVQEIKEIYGKDLSGTEFKVLIGIGKATGLNPFLREIWAVKYGGNPACIFIGRDGYRKAAQANPQYDYHVVDAVYANDDFRIEDGLVKHGYSVKDRGVLAGAYCSVKRKGSSQPIFIYVELKEYTTGKSLWQTKPATMIKKVAEAQGLRMAFQDIFAGTYDESENWNESDEKPAAKSVPVSVATPATTVSVVDPSAICTVTDHQVAKIEALLGDLDASKEQANEYTVRNFGCGILGLSLEQAGKLIEALEKRLIEKAAADVPPPPAFLAAEPVPSPEPETMTLEAIASAMGGTIIDEPIPEPAASSPAIEAMRKARDSYAAKSSGASL